MGVELREPSGTILGTLEASQVVSVRLTPDKYSLIFREECDKFLQHTLSKHDVKTLIKELQYIVKQMKG